MTHSWALQRDTCGVSEQYTQTDPQSSLGQQLGPCLPDFHFGRKSSLWVEKELQKLTWENYPDNS